MATPKRSDAMERDEEGIFEEEELEDGDGACVECEIRTGDIVVRKDGSIVHSTDPDFMMSGGVDSLICSTCYIDSKFVTCGVCHLKVKGTESFYVCIECGDDICSIACVAVTGVRDRNCICENCYDGRCVDCGVECEENESDDPLFWDALTLQSPYCEKCEDEQENADEDEDDEEDEQGRISAPGMQRIPPGFIVEGDESQDLLRDEADYVPGDEETDESGDETSSDEEEEDEDIRGPNEASSTTHACSPERKTSCH